MKTLLVPFAGGYHTTVDIPASDPPIDIVLHGGRYFIRAENGATYREAHVFRVPMDEPSTAHPAKKK
jgi:hypothetical protein